MVVSRRVVSMPPACNYKLKYVLGELEKGLKVSFMVGTVFQFKTTMYVLVIKPSTLFELPVTNYTGGGSSGGGGGAIAVYAVQVVVVTVTVTVVVVVVVIGIVVVVALLVLLLARPPVLASS
ncbi:hypothetical protein M0802_006568 [Mischocyttarus mexicanus]|nr:hypothetical protein M0802_006568 [Mischocyttarus mexicanus]